jgi:hypothetical protein
VHFTYSWDDRYIPPNPSYWDGISWFLFWTILDCDPPVNLHPKKIQSWAIMPGLTRQFLHPAHLHKLLTC